MYAWMWGELVTWKQAFESHDDGAACMRVCTPAQSLAVGTADLAALTVMTVAAAACPPDT